MVALHRTAVMVALLLLNHKTNGQGIRERTIKRNEEMCKKLAVEPFFEIDLVVGKPWRIYYTWNMKLESKCLDIVFRKATPKIIQRVSNDMYEYMAEQPQWDAASLHVTMGKPHHELLLFADQGAAGRFLAVPNVVRDGNTPQEKSAVPLLKFQLKLLREGRFLVMMDCHIGVASLAARPDRPPYQAEILSAVAPLALGDGYPACVGDRNLDEQMLTK